MAASVYSGKFASTRCSHYLALIYGEWISPFARFRMLTFFFFRLPSKHTAVERTLYGDIREFGQIARPPELIFMPPDRLAIIAIWPAEVMIQIKRRAAFTRLICSELS